MIRTSARIRSACTALPLADCATTHAPGQCTEARLEARSGNSVSGTVSFAQSGDELIVEAAVSGLTPGKRRFHVHESGDCRAPDATSAKGHVNPTGKPHGHHAGNLPNLVADAAGGEFGETGSVRDDTCEVNDDLPFADEPGTV